MRDQKQSGRHGSIGSMIMITIVRAVGRLSELFHVKNMTCSNMTHEEQTYFSNMLDDMREESRRKETDKEM